MINPIYEIVVASGLYRLRDPLVITQTGVVGFHINTVNVELVQNGDLVLKPGFLWDGPSGPVIDGPRLLGPSAAHDALYTLIAEDHLPSNQRYRADKLYRRLLKENGVSWFRRMIHFRGLNLFGGIHLWFSSRFS